MSLWVQGYFPQGKALMGADGELGGAQGWGLGPCLAEVEKESAPLFVPPGQDAAAGYLWSPPKDPTTGGSWAESPHPAVHRERTGSSWAGPPATVTPVPLPMASQGHPRAPWCGDHPWNPPPRRLGPGRCGAGSLLPMVAPQTWLPAQLPGAQGQTQITPRPRARCPYTVPAAGAPRTPAPRAPPDRPLPCDPVPPLLKDLCPTQGRPRP